MAMNDVALQALLGYRADRARQPLPEEMIGPSIQQALATLETAREMALKRREAEVRLGRPARGTPAAVSVGAAPADTRRRILGIPMGRAPKVMRIQPPMAGGTGGPSLDEIPQELLTPEVLEASTRGEPVFYRPASRNFRPPVMGQDEFRARASVFPYVTTDDPAALLTEPDRKKAFEGTTPRVRAGDTVMIPITDQMRQRAAALGVDLGDATTIPISRSALDGLVKPSKGAAPKEGDQLMDEASVLQLYQDEGLTAEQIKKAPKKLKARDYKARRGRLNAKSRGNILELLVGAGVAGAAGAPGKGSGDALAADLGF